MKRSRENIGQMRERVKIYSYSPARNDAGEEIITWSELAEVWGAIEYGTRGSNEVELAQQTTAKLLTNFRIRYRTDIDEKMILVWNSKAWNIRSILPDMYKHYLLIECEDFFGDTSGLDPSADVGDPLIDDSGEQLVA